MCTKHHKKRVAQHLRRRKLPTQVRTDKGVPEEELRDGRVAEKGPRRSATKMHFKMRMLEQWVADLIADFSNIFFSFFLKLWDRSGAKVCTSCRSPKIRSKFNAYFLAKFRFDATENEPGRPPENETKHVHQASQKACCATSTKAQTADTCEDRQRSSRRKIKRRLGRWRRTTAERYENAFQHENARTMSCKSVSKRGATSRPHENHRKNAKGKT